MTAAYEFLVRAYTEASIPHRSADPFAVTDLLGQLLSQVGGDGDSDASSAATQSASSFLFSPGDEGAYWQNQPNFRAIDARIGVIRLGRGGKSTEGTAASASAPSGTLTPIDANGASRGGPVFFFLKPQVRPLNCQMGTVAGTRQNGIPTGNPAYAVCPWDDVSGQGAFETWLPDNARSTRIACFSQLPDQTVEARTKTVFEKNRQLRFDFSFFGSCYGATQKGAFRLAWGDGTLSFVWRGGASPALERWDGKKWVSWHTLDGAPQGTFGGDWTLFVTRINGAIVVRLQGQEFSGQWDFADSQSGEHEGDARLRDVEWLRGRVSVRAFNALFSLGLSLLDSATTDAKTKKSKPFTATAERDCPRPATMSADVAGVYSALVSGSVTGWIRNGARASVMMQTLPPSQDTGNVPVVRWTLTLTASPDGIDTPCVASVWGRYEGAHTVPAPETLDVKTACLKGSFSSSEPPQMAGSEFRLDASRNLLDDLNPNWQAYLHPYHPIELAIRRRYRDGTHSPWVGRFKGYQLDTGRQNPKVNDFRTSIVCESDTKRLQKPHAQIDHRYFPLDLLYAGGKGRQLFVSQCVKEIIRIEFGEGEAARFNGNGDALRFLPPDHPALISTYGDYAGIFPLSQPMAQSGFQFPAPWGDDPLGWIKRLLAYDRTVFYYGLLPLQNGEQGDPQNPVIEWPFPICGRYEELIRDRPTHRVADAFYLPGDEDSPLTSIESRFRAELVYNHFLSWANPPGASHPLLPSLLMAQEQLPASDPNSAAHSWQRTLLMQEDFFYRAAITGQPLAGVASSVFLAMREFANKDPRIPTLVFRGDPLINWGDKIKPERLNLSGSGAQRSDPHVLRAGDEFRVLGVEEAYDFEHAGIGQYVTTAKAAPLSTDGF